MVKKLIAAVAAIAVAAGIVGCSSVETATTLHKQKLSESSSMETLAHLNGDIWGIYLFNLPLFTGKAGTPGSCIAFSDTVTTDNAVGMLAKKASKDFGSTNLIDVQTKRSSTWIFPLLVFWYRDVQVSGTACK